MNIHYFHVLIKTTSLSKISTLVSSFFDLSVELKASQHEISFDLNNHKVFFKDSHEADLIELCFYIDDIASFQKKLEFIIFRNNEKLFELLEINSKYLKIIDFEGRQWCFYDHEESF